MHNFDHDSQLRATLRRLSDTTGTLARIAHKDYAGEECSRVHRLHKNRNTFYTGRRVKPRKVKASQAVTVDPRAQAFNSKKNKRLLASYRASCWLAIRLETGMKSGIAEREAYDRDQCLLDLLAVHESASQKCKKAMQEFVDLCFASEFGKAKHWFLDFDKVVHNG